jgi:hypothetical protein
VSSNEQNISIGILANIVGFGNYIIKSTRKLIDYRSDMAHSTGKIQI